ncbi:MAG TPA: Bro-N domain-containing protein [Tepidisphaeraceae bacterium]|nr:Bro-N domain-containing protein [Tepidisphaeraceae bacterium]
MSEKLPKDAQGAMIVFGATTIRRKWVDAQWYFSVVDIIAALTDSNNPRNYWNMLKAREAKASGVQLSTFCVQLKLTSADGKAYKTECANTQSAFRIIQSIPSPKAEPFKRWLAQVGYERVQEIENPELAQQRMRELYKEKGYPDDWIEKRVRGIAVRDELTDEWKKRGIEAQKDFAILTAEISKATFGLTPADYKKLKGLKRENLRDHMTDLELIFTMLGEAATTEIARNKDARGFQKNKHAAHEGGAVAGNARRQLESKSGRKVIVADNYLSDKPKPKLPGASGA